METKVTVLLRLTGPGTEKHPRIVGVAKDKKGLGKLYDNEWEGLATKEFYEFIELDTELV